MPPIKALRTMFRFRKLIAVMVAAESGVKLWLRVRRIKDRRRGRDED